ncbi:MAG: selenocysteine-specific translation elongation factor [Solirubrobacteraceae bacterium]
MSAGPLTLGTAGHVDHGKTALVRALTGVETDRLREERERGLTIVLGYAPLALPSGRRVSMVDVPGHERFVRTMVAGASGIDAFLMVIAADDGVMPQTIEHAAVLRALGIERGVVAVSKADLADPSRASEEAAELLSGCETIACSSRTGNGLAELAAALDRLAMRLRSRAEAAPGGVRLHVDRSFTIAGRGAVLTGTLWAGELRSGDTLELASATGGRRRVRVRGLEVHDEQVDSAPAGQRVAVNLAGLRAAEAGRGDVLLAPSFGRETRILDCALALDGAEHGQRVQVHHGTRDVPGRLARLSDELWQLRLERPLLALRDDRLVVRRLAPPDTLGGGRVLDPAARRHGARPEALARLEALRDGRAAPGEASSLGAGAFPLGSPTPHPSEVERRQRGRPAAGRASGSSAESAPAVDLQELHELERRLLDAGTALLSEAQMEDARDALTALRAKGPAVRVSGRLYAHAEVLDDVRERIVALLERNGSATLADVRDALGLSRKCSQAFLERLDAERVTRRMPDDRRVLSGRRGAGDTTPAASG